MMPFRVPWRTGLGGRRAVGGVVPWYLSGGIALANCIVAYQPKGAASLAASYINLVSPGTYDAAEGTAPDFDSTNGWKFVSANSDYLETGITPALTWSALARFTNAGEGDKWMFGYYTTQGFGVQPNIAAFGHVFYNGYTKAINPQLANGVIGFAGAQGYLNGLADGTPTSQTAHAATTIFIGDINYSGGHRYWDGYLQAFAIYDTTLSAAQVLAISTAMAAL